MIDAPFNSPTTARGPLSIGGVARHTLRDLCNVWRGLVVYQVLFKLLEAWLLAPAVAFVLGVLLARTGHAAVSNFDLVAFFLSPLGVVYGLVLAATLVALLLIEQAGVMVLAARADAAPRPSWTQLAAAALPQSWRILQIAAVQVVALSLAWLPLALVALWVYNLLLSGHDIYFYWTERPPVFWVAASIGAALLLVAGAAALWLYVRWAFAVPIVLFERQGAVAALRASRDRVRGAGWRVALLLVAWPLAALLGGVLLEIFVRFLASAVLRSAGERPFAVILLLLAVRAALFAGLSFVVVVGNALTLRRLYLACSGQPAAAAPRESATDAPRWFAWLVSLTMLAVALAPLAYWISLPQTLQSRPPIRITAHRGNSAAAPENTLAAIQKAIDSRADYAEIDVQPTADGIVVLAHDRDLQRVAGDSRLVSELTFDEARKLDVGSFYSPAFAGERIPTLAEVLDSSRGHIKLNVELKFFGPDRWLVEEVVRLVSQRNMESEVLITSFDYEALQQAKRLNPKLRTGLIVAQSIGDLNRLDVDVLNVRTDLVTPQLIRAAHRAGQEVHAWTVSDPRQMVTLMRQGVDNVLTSNPDALVPVRDEWEQHSPVERLTLAARVLLGVD